MDATQRRQFGDNLHQALNDQDQLLMEQCDRLKEALTVRIKSPMKMRDGQRTIRALASQLGHSIEARDKLISAHCSAQVDAAQMGWPEDCPDVMASTRPETKVAV